MVILGKLKQQASSLLKTGFFHVFGASMINRILAALLSFILVRLLSKADYGVYAYAFNIISFFTIFNGLGVTSAILQICSELCESKTRADSIYRYGFMIGRNFDLILAATIILVALFVPMAIAGSNILLAFYSFYPLAVILFEIRTTRLRVLLENREYALSTNIQTILLVFFSLVGAITFGPLGLVVGQTLSYFIAYGIICMRYPDNPEFTMPSQQEKRGFWEISIISSFNNGISQALTLTGTFFVGAFLASDLLVANYQVATLIPYGLLFVPGALMTYAYPYFARNKNDKNWTKRNYAKLTLGSFALMGCITALCFLLAEPIFSLLFGEQYLDVVPVFKILLLGFFINGAIRQPAGNLLVTQRKLVTNMVIGIVAVVANIAFSVLLIPAYGMYGAAICYVATMAISGLLFTVAYVITIR